MPYIPHPTLNELIISMQIFICLWPLKAIGHILETKGEKEARQLRKQYVANHVYLGHKRSWWRCLDGTCSHLVLGKKIVR